jgi:hypothetical protein
VAADPHAKGEDGILKQRQSLLQCGVVTPPQELHGLFYLKTHCRKCNMPNFRSLILTPSSRKRRDLERPSERMVLIYSLD